MAFSEEVMSAIRKAADAAGLEPAALAAVVEVESGGKAFTSIGGKDMPLILYEYHVFYRALPPGLRVEAVARNLARPRWGELPYKKTQSARYAQLDRAKEIDEEAAYSACSWGVGQVLGENWKWLGYKSAKALAEAAMSGIDGQLGLMLRFIDKRGLKDELRDHDWRGFARLYNGSGQVDHYAKLMEAAYARVGGAAAQGEADDVTLRVGSQGIAVSQLQQSLRKLGHHLNVDGDFGPATQVALREFQKGNGLAVTGIADPETLGRIETLLGRDVRDVL